MMDEQADLAMLRVKERTLSEILQGMESVVVAYSGGVDSSYLAFMAHRVLGDRMVAITAVSPSLSEHQRVKAEQFAVRYGIPHRFIETREFESEQYLTNSPERCYFCKSILFEALSKLASDVGYAGVIYGANLDDAADQRPGHKAAHEYGVRGPLLEAGLHKDEIRMLSASHGLPTSRDPASPCLSSRVPYLERIDAEKLRQIEAGEELLRRSGFAEMRLRHHGAVARIEIPVGDIARLLEPEMRTRVSAALHELGFKWVTIDVDGLRSGSLSAEYK